MAEIAAAAASDAVKVAVVIAYLLGGSPSKNAESVLADGQECDFLSMRRTIVSHPDNVMSGRRCAHRQTA